MPKVHFYHVTTHNALCGRRLSTPSAKFGINQLYYANEYQKVTCKDCIKKLDAWITALERVSVDWNHLLKMNSLRAFSERNTEALIAKVLLCSP